MAIGLKDIKNPRKDKVETIPDQKEKVLRPWEAYESLGPQTRTVSAQEAVKRARQTVQKNNEFVENLKKNSYKPKDGFPENELQKRKPNWFINFLKGFIK